LYVYEFGFWDGMKGADPEVRERGGGLVNQDRERIRWTGEGFGRPRLHDRVLEINNAEHFYVYFIFIFQET
jgi:hypothetical protein